MLRHYTCRECGQTVATDRELRSYRCDCGGEMVFVGPFLVVEVDAFRQAISGANERRNNELPPKPVRIRPAALGENT